jgi:hypothetical protein
MPAAMAASAKRLPGRHSAVVQLSRNRIDFRPVFLDTQVRSLENKNRNGRPQPILGAARDIGNTMSRGRATGWIDEGRLQNATEKGPLRRVRGVCSPKAVGRCKMKLCNILSLMHLRANLHFPGHEDG